MTPVTDPIGDLLTRIRNAQTTGAASCRVPWSRLKQELSELLVREGWLLGVTVEGEDCKRELLITFRTDREPLSLTRVSKPGRRIYRSVGELKPVERGFGIAILTTSGGLITDKEARKKKIGGEVLCTVS
jgi:small subunit ribosomal protein S8